MTDRPRTFEAHLLPLTAAVAAALLVGACGPDVADTAVAVCRDASGRRIADTGCGGARGGVAHGGGGWYYYARGSTVPAEGEVATGGSSRPLAGVGYARASSASVSRGGFGGSAGEGGHGGGGGGE